jgi:uncharacterized protein (DUF58 family)
MWRVLHWMYRVVAALQRLSDRRLTRAGMLVGSVLVFAAALGVDTKLTLAYQVFAFAAALLAVAAVGLLLQRSGGYALERRLPRIATAGEPVRYTVTVRNLGGAPRDGLALIDDVRDPRPTFAEFRASVRIPTYRAWRRLVEARRPCKLPETALPAIPAHGAVEVVVRGAALRRGVQHFDGLSVARAEPLALLRGITQVAAPANLLVLPKRYPLPPIALPGSRRYQPGGVELASSIGDSEEFVGLREYRPGDPLQRIHWKSYARAGLPVVREYQDEYFERHALVLDTFAGGDAAFEDAVSIAASLACTVDTQECLLDLMFVGAQTHVFTAGRGQLSAGRLLEVLAAVQPCHARPFHTLQDAVVARRGQLTGSVCILLAWDAPRQAFVRTLRSLGVPVLVLLVTAEPVAERAPWLRTFVPGNLAADLAQGWGAR